MTVGAVASCAILVALSAPLTCSIGSGARRILRHFSTGTQCVEILRALGLKLDSLQHQAS